MDSPDSLRAEALSEVQEPLLEQGVGKTELTYDF